MTSINFDFGELRRISTRGDEVSRSLASTTKSINGKLNEIYQIVQSNELSSGNQMLIENINQISISTIASLVNINRFLNNQLNNYQQNLNEALEKLSSLIATIDNNFGGEASLNVNGITASTVGAGVAASGVVNFDITDTGSIATTDSAAFGKLSTGSTNLPPASDKTLYVGDSRTVGMGSAMGLQSGTDTIAEVGQGYDWFTTNALPQIQSQLNANPNSNVVINMGANDLGSYNLEGVAQRYANLYNNLAEQYPNSRIAVVSVNPINEALAATNRYDVSYDNNANVQMFNSALQANLNPNVQYIDTYSGVVNNLSSWDGLHYNNSTYQDIYNIIQDNLYNSKYKILLSNYNFKKENEIFLYWEHLLFVESLFIHFFRVLKKRFLSHIH